MKHDYIGEVTFELNQVMCAPSKTIVLDVMNKRNPSKKKNGTL